MTLKVKRWAEQSLATKFSAGFLFSSFLLLKVHEMYLSQCERHGFIAVAEAFSQQAESLSALYPFFHEGCGSPLSNRSEIMCCEGMAAADYMPIFS